MGVSLDSILSRLGTDISIVATGSQFLFQKRASGSVVVSVTDSAPQPPPKLWEGLPAEARQGLTTRRHTQTPPRASPVTRYGAVARFDETVKLLGDGIRQARGTNRSPIIGHRVVFTAPAIDGNELFAPEKRIWMDALERAGARRVYLCDYTMACGIGLGLKVNCEEVHGVMAIERDCSMFAVLRYADALCSAREPTGVEHLADTLRDSADGTAEPARATAEQRLLRRGLHDDDARQATTPVVTRLARVVLDALDDLTDEQIAGLRQGGLTLCGLGSRIPALASELSLRTGIPTKTDASEPHPALRGAALYIQYIDQARIAAS